MDQEKYMRRAMELAERGVGHVAPNPLVGAVIVKDGRVIGEGWHIQCGSLHAERHALLNCMEDPRGATMYVTLEPCCHEGRQPPCTQAILEAGIAKVVVGADDPNPQVAGKGIAQLRAGGVEVETGVLASQCQEQNRVFMHYIRTRRPFVVMKYAMTMDGKIATRTGASKWITGETARRRVQEDRNRYTAIMAGVGTVLADDPQLTCRIPGGRNPVRVICDSHLRTPVDSNLAKTAREVPTILAAADPDPDRQMALEAMGCVVWNCPDAEGRVDLRELMRRLGEKEIDSVLLEGGGTLNWTALSCGIVSRVQTYIAPKLFGGTEAKSPIGGLGVETPDQAVRLVRPIATVLGEDLLIESEVETDVHGNR